MGVKKTQASNWGFKQTCKLDICFCGKSFVALLHMVTIVANKRNLVGNCE